MRLSLLGNETFSLTNAPSSKDYSKDASTCKLYNDLKTELCGTTCRTSFEYKIQGDGGENFKTS